LNFAVRTSAPYKKWRKAVIKRDGYICGECEVESKKGKFCLMHVDHIVPLSFLLKENNINTVYEAIGCKALWKIENGRVLCKECHLLTDTYSGRALSYNN